MGVFQEITHNKKKGSFDLGDEGVTWTSHNGKEVKVSLADIEVFKWTPLRKSCQLVVACADAASYTFGGFSAQVGEEVDAYSKTNEKKFKKVELNTVGYNWGEFAMNDDAMTFEIDERPVFDISYASMSQSVIQGKNEVALEFHEDDIAIDNDMETLVEMRVYVPNTNEHMVIDEEDEKKNTSALVFHAAITDKADFGSKGEVIAKFDDLLFNVPRGRYSIQLFASHFLLNGKTFNYKIMYKSINRMFLLQAVDRTHHFFIIGLNPAIRQGRTTYPYLILQFGTEETVSMELGIDEKKIEEKYGDRIKKQEEGPLYDVVSRLFSALTINKKIIIPSVNYTSYRGVEAVSASYKANDGYLYILEKSFFFVKKPAIYIRHDQITSIEFSRLSGGESTRTFDLLIHINDPTTPCHTFTSIDRNEYNALFQFFTSKKLHISNVKGQLQVTASGRLVGSTNMNEGSDSDEDDPYMARAKAEAGSADENSSDDEDFKAASADGSTTDDSSDFSENDAAMVNTSDEDKDVDKSEDEDDDDVIGSDGEVKPKTAKKRKAPEKKEKKEKKEKAVKGPKKARSAYTFFVAAQSATIKAANPDLTFQQLSAKYGSEWKALDEEAKAPYVAQAAEDQARSKAEREKFTAEHGSPTKKGKGKSKKKGGPKQGMSAFMFFSNKMRPIVKAENPTWSFGELAKHVGSKWKEMGEEDKAEFNNLAAEDKERYTREKKAWDEEDHSDGEESPKKEKKKGKKGDDGGDEGKKEKKKKRTKEEKEEHKKEKALRKAERAERRRLKAERRKAREEAGQAPEKMNDGSDKSDKSGMEDNE